MHTRQAIVGWIRVFRTKLTVLTSPVANALTGPVPLNVDAVVSSTGTVVLIITGITDRPVVTRAIDIDTEWSLERTVTFVNARIAL